MLSWLTPQHQRTIALIAFAVLALHVLDDAIVESEHGSSLGARLGASAFAIGLMGGGALTFLRARQAVRGLIAIVYGLLALSGGVSAHVAHIIDEGAAGGDYTGALYALTGLTLAVFGLTLLAREITQRSNRTSPA